MKHALRHSALTAAAFLAAISGADPSAWVEGSTTLVILPDTERYSDNYPELFEAQTKWILENHEQRDIAHVLHLGDITQHDAPIEWEVEGSFLAGPEKVRIVED
jgi:hypothetical protein